MEATNDRINIARVKNRVMDYDKTIGGVIGDNVMFSKCFSEADYFDIRLRKKLSIPLENFDYVIENSENDRSYFLFSSWSSNK